MSLIRIDHNPSRRQLAVFGAIWAVFFGGLGVIVLGRSGWLPAAVVVWVVAVIVPAIGAGVPEFMRLVYLGMAYAAFPIGFVLSHLMLAAAYYLVMTPIGLLMRLFGHDPMRRRFDADAETYWVEREAKSDVDRYFRQF